MDLNHLHLHVTSVERACAFYERYFGFREHVRHGTLVFVRNERGFDLALAPDDAPDALPRWFHFGFRLGSASEVRALFSAMHEGGADIAQPYQEDGGHVWFRVRDPDGYSIEVYYE